MTDTPRRDTLDAAYGLGGKVALVTGGGSGLGLGIAKCLHIAGAHVVIAGRRRETLEAARDEIGPDCSVRVLDVTDIDAAESHVADVAASFGALDILVNNAGNTRKQPFDESTPADFDAVFDVHVRGALALTRHVLRLQMQRGGGSVIFLSSMTAFIGQPLVLGYTVSKSALSGVIRGLAAEYSSHGIRVNGVAPGWIDTDIYRQATAGDPVRRDKIMSRIPMGRLGQPEDIGWACAFLASPAAGYITGQILLCDGGGATGF